MALFADNPYNQSQLFHAAPSVPPDISARPDILPTLQTILEICRRDWIFRFLFTTDTAHLTFLTSPLFKREAITSNMSLHHFEPPMFTSHPYSLNLRGITVLVPAFSVHEFSIGFGVEERNASFNHSASLDTTASNSSKQPEPDQFRYVGNINTGQVILVFLAQQSVTIECISHISTTQRHRVWSRFDNSILDILGAPFAPADIHSILSSLTACIAVREFRACPLCNSSPHICCLCPDPMAICPPDVPHPTLHIFHSHIGAFEGLLHQTTFQQGVPLQQQVLVSRAMIQGEPGREHVYRLTDWVVRQNLLHVDIHPCALMRIHVSNTATYGDRKPLVAKAESGGIMRLASLEWWCTEESHPDTSQSLLPVNIDALHWSKDSEEIQHISHESEEGHVPNAARAMEEQRKTDRRSKDEGCRCLRKKAVRRSNERIELNLYEEDSEEDRRIAELEEKRIARNRASARRSNLRRKAEIEGKKRELNCLKQREKELRCRESQLRGENLWLRGLYELGADDRHSGKNAAGRRRGEQQHII